MWLKVEEDKAKWPNQIGTDEYIEIEASVVTSESTFYSELTFKKTIFSKIHSFINSIFIGFQKISSYDWR